MKKHIIFGLLLSLFFPTFAQTEYGESEIPVKAALQYTNSFSMIMIGDPQAYINWGANQPLFEFQLAWVAQNKEKLNVLTTLLTGDYVEQNNRILNLHSSTSYVFRNGDQTSEQQWKAVSRALERLDGQVPYVACQGNHDVGFVAAENHLSEMSKYFYPSRNPLNDKHLVAMGTNVEGKRTMENAAYEFNTDTWGDLLIVVLEFAPRDEALDWARELINSPKYANHRVFLLLHSFMQEQNGYNAAIYTSESYQLTPRNWGMDVWNKLIKDSKNIVMVLCGHSGNPPTTISTTTNYTESSFLAIPYDKTCSFRNDYKATDGHVVPMMMFNAQAADGTWRGNGGDGWLRILEFKSDGTTVSVRTFSPLFACSRITCKYAWRKASYDQFTFTIPKLK